MSIGVKKYFRWNIVIHEQDRYICFEIIDKAYQHIGIDLKKDELQLADDLVKTYVDSEERRLK